MKVMRGRRDGKRLPSKDNQRILKGYYAILSRSEVRGRRDEAFRMFIIFSRRVSLSIKAHTVKPVALKKKRSTSRHYLSHAKLLRDSGDSFRVTAVLTPLYTPQVVLKDACFSFWADNQKDA